MEIISAERIEATQSFKKIKEAYLKAILLKRENRKVIDQALVMYKTTGQIPNTLNRHQLNIVNELIQEDEKEKT